MTLDEFIATHVASDAELEAAGFNELLLPRDFQVFVLKRVYARVDARVAELEAQVMALEEEVWRRYDRDEQLTAALGIAGEYIREHLTSVLQMVLWSRVPTNLVLVTDQKNERPLANGSELSPDAAALRDAYFSRLGLERDALPTQGSILYPERYKPRLQAELGGVTGANVLVVSLEEFSRLKSGELEVPEWFGVNWERIQ